MNRRAIVRCSFGTKIPGKIVLGNHHAAGPHNYRYFPGPARATAVAFENSGVVLLVQPLEKFLKARVCKNDFYVVERVPQFIMTPGFVDKILAGMARGHDLRSALATRNDCGGRASAPFAYRIRILTYC